jgi:hypothetical protein
LGFDGVQMAEAIDISQGMWSGYQSGSRQITVKHAKRLCDIANASLRHSELPKVTLDYIYRGLLRVKSKKQ